jgi:UDP-2,4-diacetamido-2,4,6-trideoxy-beta-L-altropyranose hydrolase
VKVLLWVDAGPALGLGHLSRCLALAEALGGRGARCRFALAPDATALGWLRAAGQRDVLALPDPERALADVLQAVRDADAVVVDVKRPLERREVRALGGNARVLVIDNPGPGAAEADLVVAPFGTARDERWLVGAEWLPLRPPVTRDSTLATDDGRTVLVSMGGSDPGGLSAPVIDALGPVTPRLRVVAIVNPLAPVWHDSTVATARWGFAPAMPTEPGRAATWSTRASSRPRVRS